MDLKNEYNKLYKHWLKEVQDLGLTSFSQDIFEEYKKSVEFLNNYRVDKEDIIKFEILNSYKENFQYLLSDFLKIRELKIINAALSLQDIDKEKVIEAEKLFFQNLVSSIKGFEKLKKLSINENFEPIKIEEILDVSKVEKPIKTANSFEINDTHYELENQKSKIPNSISVNKGNEELYNYTLIRFLKKAPPLVGIDLINYGPFTKEDIALMPYKNAIILLTEKFAENIDFSY